MTCKHDIKPCYGYGATIGTHSCRFCGKQVTWKFNRYITAQPMSWFVLDGFAWVFKLLFGRPK